jgi:hypothetical protein
VSSFKLQVCSPSTPNCQFRTLREQFGTPLLILFFSSGEEMNCGALKLLGNFDGAFVEFFIFRKEYLIFPLEWIFFRNELII